MVENVGRRDVLTLLAISALVQRGFPIDGKGNSSADRTIPRTNRAPARVTYDEIIRGESVDDLDEPDDPPAFAITDTGVWEWYDGEDGWQPLSLSADALGSRNADPIPVFDNVDVGGNDISDVGSFDAARTYSNQFTQRLTGDVELPAEGIVDRPLATTEPVELFVDPDGDDGNTGEESEPVATLQEALNRLPFLLQHEVRIELSGGTYDEHRSGIHTVPHLITNLKSGNLDQEEAFHVVGDPDAPSNVYLTNLAKLNFSFLGTAIHRTKVEGLELDCSITNYGGRMTVANCIINGNERDLPGVTGYQSHTLVDSCTFTDGLDYAVGPTNMGRAVVTGCDGHVGEYVFRPRSGGRVTDRGNDVTATYGLYDTESMDSGGTYQRAAGIVPTENAVLCDDFGDGRLFDRRISTTATYRPQWRDPGGGNPVVEDGYLVFQNSSLDRIEVDYTASSPPGVEGQWFFTTGTWTIDYRFEFESESNGVVTVHFINDGDRNGWHVRLWSDRIDLRKRGDGELSTVAQWDVDEDTDRHRLSIERSPADEWTLERDDEQIASVTDSFLPRDEEHTAFEIRGREFGDDERAELYNVAFYNR